MIRTNGPTPFAAAASDARIAVTVAGHLFFSEVVSLSLGNELTPCCLSQISTSVHTVKGVGCPQRSHAPAAVADGLDDRHLLRK